MSHCAIFGFKQHPVPTYTCILSQLIANHKHFFILAPSLVIHNEQTFCASKCFNLDSLKKQLIHSLTGATITTKLHGCRLSRVLSGVRFLWCNSWMMM